MSGSSRSIGAHGRTVLSLLAAQVQRRGESTALRWKEGRVWRTESWRDWDAEARAIAAGLVARGLAAGDRVAMPLRTRRHALVADVAALLAGAIPVPIYPTLAADQTAAIVADCGATVLVVEDAAALEALETLESLGTLRLVVVIDGPAPAASPTRSAGVTCVSWDALAREGRAALGVDAELVERRASAVRPDDAAALLYTSGTTGEPKGVELTHAAFVFQVDAVVELFGIGPADEQLLFLPIAHVFGRILVVAAMRVGAVTAIASSMLSALDEAEEVRPTYLGTVPRLLEKLQQAVLARVAEAGRAQEKIFEWAMSVGRRGIALRGAGRPVPLGLEVQLRYADKLVFQKIRARLGGRLRFAISGAAPIDAALCEWLQAMGILVLEGYGLTETTAAATLNHPQAYRFGSVGRALPGVELRIEGGAEGEVLVRGPNVMRGYWHRAAETAAHLDDQGWLHTGDVGTVDDEGYLRITDRKKDLLVTAGGKNVAPQRIEALLAATPTIQRAIVLGDRRPYLVALIVPDFEAIRALSDHWRASDAATLARDPQVRARVQADVDAVNARLGPFETVKRFALLTRDLRLEEGELTPTLKVRRRVVEVRHRAAVDAMY